MTSRCYRRTQANKFANVDAEREEGMIAKVLKKDTRFEYGQWRGICKPSAVTKMTGKIILKHIQKHLESLIGKEQPDFHIGFPVPTTIAPMVFEKLSSGIIL